MFIVVLVLFAVQCGRGCSCVGVCGHRDHRYRHRDQRPLRIFRWYCLQLPLSLTPHFVSLLLLRLRRRVSAASAALVCTAMPMKAMSKMVLPLPAHVDLEELCRYLDRCSVTSTAALFQEVHGLARWRLNGPKGITLPVGQVGRSLGSGMLHRRTLEAWRSMGREIGVVVLPLQHPQYYQLLENVYVSERPAGRRCQMHTCGKCAARRGMLTKAYGMIDLCRDHCRNLKKRGQLSEASGWRVHPGDDAPPAA